MVVHYTKSFIIRVYLVIIITWKIRVTQSAGTVEYADYISAGVLGMTLKCIWWWGSSPEALRNVEYLFIAISPRSTLTLRGNAC